MRALACWLFAAGTLVAQTPGFHLPDNFVPLKYTANLRIDPSSEIFDGSISIRVRVRKPAASLFLDAKDLLPTQVSADGRHLDVRVANAEMIEILGTGNLANDFTLDIAYRGHIDDKAVDGAYRRKVDGEWYVYTTFTPIEARRAFPCFDELTEKAPWEISIQVPPGNRAFSNAAELSESASADGTTYHFAPTQPLSTELVAFAAGPFDTYEVPPIAGEPAMRVITSKGHAADGKTAAESAAALMPRLEAYTGMPYAFGKLDHLAMADAGFSAVENPGLIVYLDKQLLLPPGTETAERARAVRYLEAHEMGHQWFGDLVTQADWNDLWLSEAFATWIADKMMDEEEQPRRARLSAIVGRERIMRVDNSIKTHPVRLDVQSRDDTLDLYNRVTYDKGAAVLMMLEGWLGEEKFHEAIRAYLHDYRFSNAATRDFANELKQSSGTNPAAVLHSYLDAVGIPRVQAQIQCDRTMKLVFRQTGATAIPICYRGDGISQTCVELDRGSQEVELKSCPSWMYFNSNGTGYYRTIWDAKPLAALPLDQLSPAEKLTLAYDLEAHKNSASRGVLDRLQKDAEPEIVQAATEALK